MKLLIAITNRSSYNKVKTIIPNLHSDIQPLLLLGGGINLYRFGQVDHIIEKDFPDLPVYKVHLAVEGDDFGKMAKTVGLGVIEISTLLDTIRPDAVLTVADRFETLATAIAASYKNYPLIHLQGGENTGTIDNKVRNAITMMADIHFPATRNAGCRVETMTGSDQVYVCGCPSMDLLVSNPVIRALRESPIQIGAPDYNYDVYGWLNYHVNMKGTGSTINVREPYMIVMVHGDTTDKGFVPRLMEIPSALDMVDCQKIVFWNNIDPRGDIIAKMWREYGRDSIDKVRFIRHLEPEIFGGLMWFAKCIVGNSSSGIREANFLGTYAVNIGDRQHGREHGANTVTVPMDKKAIVDAIMEDYRPLPDNIYGDGYAGRRIARRIHEIFCRQEDVARVLAEQQPISYSI